MLGFKGSKKGTPFAAQQAADRVASSVIEMGLLEVDVFVKGLVQEGKLQSAHFNLQDWSFVQLWIEHQCLIMVVDQKNDEGIISEEQR